MDSNGPDEPTPPRPWPKSGSRSGTDYRIFRSRFDTLTNPRTGRSMERVVLETPDWVNVVAVTPGGEIVTVLQHRFGTEAPTIEIPGGMVDPGEEPLAAARRELREETGYASDHWQDLGPVAPNPAFQDNLCHHFLALDAAPVGPPLQDEGEDIVVATMTPAALRDAIHGGQVQHALVVTAISRVVDLRVPDRPHLDTPR